MKKTNRLNRTAGDSGTTGEGEMRRRFLLRATGLAVSAAIGSRMAMAQPAKSVPHVAYVYLYKDGPSRPMEHAFIQRMAELGWVNGQTVSITIHNAGGDPQKLAAIMRELVDSKVDVIVGACTPETKAAQKATSTIPIVVAATGDPVAAGVAASLARPGGNVTGVSGMWLDQSAKRISLLKELVPSIKRASVIWNPERPDNKIEVDAMATAARSLGIQLDSLQVRTAVELSDTLEMLPTTRPQGLLNAGDALVNGNFPRIIDYLNRAKLPAVFEDRYFVDLGGLMSYGPSLPEMHIWAAEYVDKILKGAKPADLPFRQPSKFELVINMQAAKKLGIAIPRSLLVRADEVIR
jgi:putative ABC transport system substrate-binding protein